MYIDTHFHLFLDDTDFNLNQVQVVEEAIEKGVELMVLTSTDKNDMQKNTEFAKKYSKNIKQWLGFHPDNFKEYDKKYLESKLKESEGRVVGIGEIGIDLNNTNKNTLEKQQEVFEDQIKIAKAKDVPFAIHSRNSFYETLEVIKKYANLKFVWHCFNLEKEKTELLLKKFSNIYFGLNAIVTYKSGKYIEESLKIIPKNRILCETDAPFLAPRPFVYKYNTPIGVISVYNYIQKVLDENLEKQIENNFHFLCQKEIK